MIVNYSPVPMFLFVALFSELAWLFFTKNEGSAGWIRRLVWEVLLSGAVKSMVKRDQGRSIFGWFTFSFFESKCVELLYLTVLFSTEIIQIWFIYTQFHLKCQLFMYVMFSPYDFSTPWGGSISIVSSHITTCKKNKTFTVFALLLLLWSASCGLSMGML